MTGDTGKRRWMPLALGVSVAINMAVVAAVAGAAWRHKDEDHRAMRGPKGAPAFIQALPREARQAVRGELRASKPRTMDTAGIVAVLRQEPFDVDAVERVMEAEIDAGMVRLRGVRQAWLKQITAMDAQERSAYAQRLEALAERRKSRLQKFRNKD